LSADSLKTQSGQKALYTITAAPVNCKQQQTEVWLELQVDRLTKKGAQGPHRRLDSPPELVKSPFLLTQYYFSNYYVQA